MSGTTCNMRSSCAEIALEIKNNFGKSVFKARNLREKGIILPPGKLRRLCSEGWTVCVENPPDGLKTGVYWRLTQKALIRLERAK